MSARLCCVCAADAGFLKAKESEREMYKKYAAHVDNPDNRCVTLDPIDDAFFAEQVPKLAHTLPPGAQAMWEMQEQVRALDVKFGGDTARSRKGIRWSADVLQFTLAKLGTNGTSAIESDRHCHVLPSGSTIRRHRNRFHDSTDVSDATIARILERVAALGDSDWDRTGESDTLAPSLTQFSLPAISLMN